MRLSKQKERKTGKTASCEPVAPIINRSVLGRMNHRIIEGKAEKEKLLNSEQ
jgi:hypothetical protein